MLQYAHVDMTDKSASMSCRLPSSLLGQFAAIDSLQRIESERCRSNDSYRMFVRIYCLPIGLQIPLMVMH